MKFFRTRFLVMCGSLILAVAALAPVAAQCPDGEVSCGGGKTCKCAGTQQGTNCVYSQACVTGGCCRGGSLELPVDEGGVS